MSTPVKPVDVKLNKAHQPLFPSLHHQRPILSRPISSLSFRTPSQLCRRPIKVSASSSSPSSSFRFFHSETKTGTNFLKTLNPDVPKPQIHRQAEVFSPTPLLFSVLKSTLVATITAAAIIFSRFHIGLKPAIAAPASPPPAMEAESSETASDEEKERVLEEYIELHPDDIEALRSLMEFRIKSGKLPEAIGIVEKLIELDPKEIEWPLLRAHLHVHSGELELGRNEFNEILSKDPLRIEAFHGLIMAASEAESDEDLKAAEKRVEDAMKQSKKEHKKNEYRDFKLLLAQIRVIEGHFDEALRVYQELVNEEPRDFRPYLCQGMIYTMMRKNEEAEKNFEKYRRLVPKEHPYARYFNDNMIATKLFAQKVEHEMAGSKS